MDKTFEIAKDENAAVVSSTPLGPKPTRSFKELRFKLHGDSVTPNRSVNNLGKKKKRRSMSENDGLSVNWAPTQSPIFPRALPNSETKTRQATPFGKLIKRLNISRKLKHPDSSETLNPDNSSSQMEEDSEFSSAAAGNSKTATIYKFNVTNNNTKVVLDASCLSDVGVENLSGEDGVANETNGLEYTKYFSFVESTRSQQSGQPDDDVNETISEVVENQHELQVKRTQNAMEAKDVEHQERISELVSRMSSMMKQHEDEKSSLTAKLSQSDKKVCHLESKLLLTETKYVQLESKLLQTEAKYATEKGKAEEEHDEVKKEKARLEARLAEEAIAKSSLESEISEVKNKLRNFQSDESARSAIHVDEILRLRYENSSMSKTCQDLTVENRSLKLNREEAANKIDDLEEQVRQKSVEVEMFKTKLKKKMRTSSLGSLPNNQDATTGAESSLTSSTSGLPLASFRRQRLPQAEKRPTTKLEPFSFVLREEEKKRKAKLELEEQKRAQQQLRDKTKSKTLPR